mmetsp:Transcript_2193/g.7920  ORF Transcript_2193/g.7920 Transcript_2193/m.7920 type:complete len:598 (+) Transcript_2193:1534-3327(+)
MGVHPLPLPALPVVPLLSGPALLVRALGSGLGVGGEIGVHPIVPTRIGKVVLLVLASLPSTHPRLVLSGILTAGLPLWALVSLLLLLQSGLGIDLWLVLLHPILLLPITLLGVVWLLLVLPRLVLHHHVILFLLLLLVSQLLLLLLLKVDHCGVLLLLLLGTSLGLLLFGRIPLSIVLGALRLRAVVLVPSIIFGILHLIAFLLPLDLLLHVQAVLLLSLHLVDVLLPVAGLLLLLFCAVCVVPILSLLLLAILFLGSHHVIRLAPDRSPLLLSVLVLTFLVLVIPQALVRGVKGLVHVTHLLVQVLLVLIPIVIVVLVVRLVFLDVKHVSLEIVAHFHALGVLLRLLTVLVLPLILPFQAFYLLLVFNLVADILGTVTLSHPCPVGLLKCAILVLMLTVLVRGGAVAVLAQSHEHRGANVGELCGRLEQGQNLDGEVLVRRTSNLTEFVKARNFVANEAQVLLGPQLVRGQNLEELKEAPFHLANVLRVHLTAQHGQLCSGKVCLKGFPVIPLGLELLVTSFTPVQGELLNPNENAFGCSRKAVSKSCGKGGIFLVIRGLPHSRFTDVRNRRELLSESPRCTLHRGKALAAQLFAA